MGDPRRDDIEAPVDDRLATLVHCFLAEGSGAGVGLLGVLRATGLFAEPHATAGGRHRPVDGTVSS